MSRIFIDETVPNTIDEIAWKTRGGEEESVKKCRNNTMVIRDTCGEEIIIYWEDIPKLMKALLKAKELGWWSDDE